MNTIPEHPLVTNLDDLSEEELLNKISDLRKKYGAATRMNNAWLAHQVLMALQNYQSAYTAKLNNNPDLPFDSVIDIS